MLGELSRFVFGEIRISKTKPYSFLGISIADGLITVFDD